MELYSGHLLFGVSRYKHEDLMNVYFMVIKALECVLCVCVCVCVTLHSVCIGQTLHPKVLYLHANICSSVPLKVFHRVLIEP